MFEGSESENLPSALFKNGGYYTTLVQPGLRIVSLNTGYVETGGEFRDWYFGRKSIV